MIKTSVTGFVKEIQEEKKFSDKFAKKTLILETLNEYNPIVAVDFINARMDVLNDIKEGMSVDVHVDIFSRESTKTPGQYFNNVTGWKIDPQQDEEISPEEEKEFQKDDLPF